MPAPNFGTRAGWRAFAAARRGATAVEFAIIAFPFLMLLIGIVELGLLLIANTTIEAATAAEARQIRTGQFQAVGGASAADFKSAVCRNMSWIPTSDCTANLQVDVRTFASFSAIDVTPPVSNGQIDTSQLRFTPGGPCDIVLVRTFYPWTLLAPVLEPGLPNLNAGQRLLTTAAAFRNENTTTSGQAQCT